MSLTDTSTGNITIDGDMQFSKHQQHIYLMGETHIHGTIRFAMNNGIVVIKSPKVKVSNIQGAVVKHQY